MLYHLQRRRRKIPTIWDQTPLPYLFFSFVRRVLGYFRAMAVGATARGGDYVLYVDQPQAARKTARRLSLVAVGKRLRIPSVASCHGKLASLKEQS